MARIVKRWPMRRLGVGAEARERVDMLAGEEPLEIRLGGTSYSVTMRTPGADVDLVSGFLVSEGVISRAEQVQQMAYSGVNPDGTQDYNILDVRLAEDVLIPQAHRHVYTSSSCGVCGTTSIEAVQKTSTYPVADDDAQVTVAALAELPQRLRTAQEVFSRTGGVHAAGLFRAAQHRADGLRAAHDSGNTPDDKNAPDDGKPADGGGEPDRESQPDPGSKPDRGGEPDPGSQPDPGSKPGREDAPELLCVREDVGRHNAVDKVVGWALREELLPLRGCVLQVSGRASFELVQKAAMAGIPVLSAVSAPSALAAELADEVGLTLIAFNRDGRMNVYTGPHRVAAR